MRVFTCLQIICARSLGGRRECIELCSLFGGETWKCGIGVDLRELTVGLRFVSDVLKSYLSSFLDLGSGSLWVRNRVIARRDRCPVCVAWGRPMEVNRRMRPDVDTFHSLEVSAEPADWTERRVRLERAGKQCTVNGVRHFRFWGVLECLAAVFELAMRLIGLHSRGDRNAATVELTEVERLVGNLPASFGGYQVLQLSDLHIDCLPQTTAHAAKLINGLRPEVCLLTDDLTKRTSGPYEQILKPLSSLLEAITTRDGVFGVLGHGRTTGDSRFDPVD